MKPVAILISGAGSNMEALITSMTGAHPARPVLVLSDTPEAPGLARARALGVPAQAIDRRAHADRAAFERALADALEACAAEIICLAGFMRVLSPEFVARFKGRMLNIHPSLLPRHRGLHTHERVLAVGETESGCTVHEVTAELDDGPILGQVRVPVLTDDTPESLATRVRTAEHRLYPAVLRRFAADDKRPIFLP
jgi:phosphoribosylglycinamide formyltransferase 1